MRDPRGGLYLGIFFVFLGVSFLLNTMLNINLWGLFCPMFFIVLGSILLMRPQMIDEETAIQQKLIGDIERDGPWTVQDEEIWVGAGDIKLDMTQAEIPPGETNLQIFSFAADVDLKLPEEVGLAVSTTSFVNEVKIFGEKDEGVLAPVSYTSDNYQDAERKIRLKTTAFVSSLKVR